MCFFGWHNRFAQPLALADGMQNPCLTSRSNSPGGRARLARDVWQTICKSNPFLKHLGNVQLHGDGYDVYDVYDGCDGYDGYNGSEG